MTTDTTSSAATAPIEPDPDRVQHLDPRTLLIDANVRHDTKATRELAASLRDHGFIHPIRAVATDDGHARVRAGHRRTLSAIMAGLDTVPVIVHPGTEDADDAEAERLAHGYAENTHREDLSAAEQLDVFAGLADLGLSAGQIATKTKARRRDVADALRAARRPEVREAVTAANLTLAQGAALDEFAEDEEAYSTLLDRLTNPRGYGPNFEHTVARLRSDRDERTARTALLAELDAAGTPVIEQPSFHSATTRLIDLTNTPAPDAAEAVDLDALDTAPADLDDLAGLADEENGLDDVDEFDADGFDTEDDDLDEEDDEGDRVGPPPITPAEHASCPGHAAYVTTTCGGPGRGPRVVAVHVCTDPAGHGHRSRTGAPLRPATSQASAPRSDETEEQAADRIAAEKETEKVKRRRVIAGNKAWDAAATVRREFLAELLTRKTPPKGACSWMARAFLTDRYTVCRAAERGHGTAAELLCPTAGDGQPDHERISKLADGASENRATVLTLGMVLGAIEGETHRHQWRWNEDRSFGEPNGSLVRYLHQLQAWGYPLAPIERLAIGEPVTDADVFDAPTSNGAGTGQQAEGDRPDPEDAEDPEDAGER